MTTTAAPIVDRVAMRLLADDIGETGARAYLGHFRDGLSRRLERITDALRCGHARQARRLVRNLAAAGEMAGAVSLAQAATALGDSLQAAPAVSDTDLDGLASLVWATAAALDEVLPSAPGSAVAG